MIFHNLQVIFCLNIIGGEPLFVEELVLLGYFHNEKAREVKKFTLKVMIAFKIVFGWN